MFCFVSHLQDEYTTVICTVYRVILSILDPRKREYLKDYSLDFEHEYMDSGGEYFHHLL
jgi:hypothetical protein